MKKLQEELSSCKLQQFQDIMTSETPAFQSDEWDYIEERVLRIADGYENEILRLENQIESLHDQLANFHVNIFQIYFPLFLW